MLPQLTSLFGLVVFLGLAWAVSVDRRRFPWRTVAAGLGLQVGLGLLILKTGPGRAGFEAARGVVDAFLESANAGALLVFGPLADNESLAASFPERPVVLAVTITATIILVSTVSALLYHWGLLQRVVRVLAWVMRRAMRLSGSESLAAAANIFMGQTEAPMVVRPYLKGMTRSELMAVMSGGMATIAGGVLAIYVGLGIDAGHLLTASIMSAPAALMIAKIMVPERERAARSAVEEPEARAVNGLDALCRGAGEGMKLSLNVIAMLLAFTALVALINGLLGWGQGVVGVVEPWTLQDGLGLVNAPFAMLLGVPSSEALTAGAILGERIVLNEFIAYLSLTGEPGAELGERTRVLLTYALCGFANLSSVAIQVGGIGGLEPSRRGDIARLGFRSMLAGVLASYSTAAVVGLML